MTFHILGISSSRLTHIFQRGGSTPYQIVIIFLSLKLEYTISGKTMLISPSLKNNKKQLFPSPHPLSLQIDQALNFLRFRCGQGRRPRVRRGGLDFTLPLLSRKCMVPFGVFIVAFRGVFTIVYCLFNLIYVFIAHFLYVMYTMW